MKRVSLCDKIWSMKNNGIARSVKVVTVCLALAVSVGLPIGVCAVQGTLVPSVEAASPVEHERQELALTEHASREGVSAEATGTHVVAPKKRLIFAQKKLVWICAPPRKLKQLAKAGSVVECEWK